MAAADPDLTPEIFPVHDLEFPGLLFNIDSNDPGGVFLINRRNSMQ